MADAPTIDWEGKSGTKYRYWIYSIDTEFDAVPANYIYAKESKPHHWRPVYIGETRDLSDRTLDSHHKEKCIEDNGATHIHVHKSSDDEDIRRDEESDLVAKWAPICNG
jgi:hypothetical protein